MVGPNLNQVTIRRTDDWLMNWLEDPSAVKPGTLMPKFAWTEGDREALIAFLHQLAKPVDKDNLLKGGGSQAEIGEKLVKAYQCFACHAIAGEAGRALYPDLTTVKQRRDPDWEKSWLADPAKLKPQTFMPNFHLSPAEIDAIVSYLYR